MSPSRLIVASLVLALCAAAGAAPDADPTTVTPYALPDVGDGDPGDDPGLPPNVDCHPFTITYGSHSGFGYNAPGFLGADLLIRTPAAWETFWQTHTGNLDPAPEAPPVDFREHIVLAVIQGPQSSGGGPNIAIVGIEHDGPFVNVIVMDDERPGPLDVITNPFHVVLLHRACLPPHAALSFAHVAPPPDSAVLHGRVFAADDSNEGRPLPGAHVTLHGTAADEPVRHAVTGLNGSYFFVGLEPGQYVARAEAHGFEPQEAPIDLAPNAFVQHDFTLLPGEPPAPAVLMGVVLTGGAGFLLPVAEAHIVLFNDGGMAADTMTDAFGFYVFPELAPGHYGILVEHPDFAPVEDEVVLPPGEIVVRHFILEAGLPPEFGAFGGLVLGADPSGTEFPLPRARVALHSEDGTFGPVAFTNDAGEFLMDDVPVGAYIAQVHSPGWAPASAEIQILPGELTEHVFVLIPDTDPTTSQSAALVR